MTAHQLAMLFDDSPIPEARMIDSGVLVGPALVREWWPELNKERAAVCFLVRRLAGEYCYATESIAGSCWSGYSTSFKWNRFSDLQACIGAAMKETERNVHKIMNINDDKLPKSAAAKLLTAFECGDYIERIYGADE